MWARITTLRMPLDRLEESIRMVDDRVIPPLKGMAGYAGGYWMADRDSGKAVTVALWETEGAVRATDVAVAKLREMAASIDATVESVEVFEVTNQA
jgi:hypothetical protein